MADHLEIISTPEDDPKWNMPYAAAVKVRSGRTVWVSGVTAAPVYHSHPHVAAEFDDVPLDPAAQTRAAFTNLEKIAAASGGSLEDLVALFRFVVDVDENQDAINRTQHEFVKTLTTTTTVEVVRLATDPRLVLELTAVLVVDD